MKFDTAYIDLTKVKVVGQKKGNLYFLKILPITYTDNIRKPRLPRKSSKQTNLQVDTNHIFQHAFYPLKNNPDPYGRFKVVIKVYKSNDGLGGGDLDNYCKAILDAITSTKKVWTDDRQVDDLRIKRTFSNSCDYSYIDLEISKL